MQQGTRPWRVGFEIDARIKIAADREEAALAAHCTSRERVDGALFFSGAFSMAFTVYRMPANGLKSVLTHISRREAATLAYFLTAALSILVVMVN